MAFCNQKHITGCVKAPRAQDIDDAVNVAVSSKNFDSNNSEIAFFGGSFTTIEPAYMVELLSSASKYIKNKTVSGIRISTRPDCIDSQVLETLKFYGVTSIELGAQSMVDEVLSANNRGHKSEDVTKASRLIKEYGFSLGLQMMTGLFSSTREFDIKTARKIIELRPDTVRIYPTITIKNTYLEKLYLKGEYVPPTIEDTVSLAVILEDMFSAANINVIRIGLHSIENDSYVAGPWHPAFGELCQSYRYRLKLNDILQQNKTYNIYVSPNDVSKFIGQNRSNISYFEQRNIKIKIIPDNSVNKSDFTIKEVN